MPIARNPTVFVSGGSRGIGLAIALKLAKEAKANVCIAAKTATPHPKLPGTIYTAAEAIEEAGGKALPLVVDIRQADQVEKAISFAGPLFCRTDPPTTQAIEETASKFDGIDVVINNASAISLTDSQNTPVKTYDLMSAINGRGTYLTSALAIPHLLRSAEAGRNPHILSLAPPLRGNLTPDMLGGCTAYSMAKLAMSLATVGLAGELKGKVGVNALWPLTYISTEAIRLLIGAEGRDRSSRHPSIVADAAFAMLEEDGRSYSGNFEIDELVLRRMRGLTNSDLTRYSPDPSMPFSDLHEDLFIPQWVRDEVAELRGEEGNEWEGADVRG
ncbi:short-chain dehydrogenase/reductase SDR family protein [Rhodotorula toruloides]|uniref:Short-chain dehydrogenase/reductase SDR family protein n=1 Tax=Rhodotorula toruloides TaxID=5286 RepID=A0A511KHI5_RHOTO|nr:short-chain dehydrogenase/reductase SDR family protein [Rhodotorula toruloides]